jgi:hypothetical protein
MRLPGIRALALPLVATLAIASCRDDAASSAPIDDGGGAIDAGAAGDAACSALFGLPNAHTGLGADRCGPSCACSATPFTAPTYDGAFVDALLHDFQLQAP